MTFAHRPSECVPVRAGPPGCLNNSSGDVTLSPSIHPSPPPGPPFLSCKWTEWLTLSHTPSPARIHFHYAPPPPAPPPLQPSCCCSNRPPSISHLSLFLAPSRLLYRSTIPTTLYSLTCHWLLLLFIVCVRVPRCLTFMMRADTLHISLLRGVGW